MPIGFNLKERSALFKRSAKNSAWSSAEYLAYPLLFLIATPYLVHRLGVEQYGIWMLVNGLAGMTGLVGMGLGDALVKYVSQYWAEDNQSQVVGVIRTTFAVFILVAAVSAVGMYFLAPFFVNSVFRVEGETIPLAIAAMRAGGLVLAARVLDSVFQYSLKGVERFDLTAQVGIVVRILILGSALGLSLRGHSVVEILGATAFIIMVGAIVQSFAVVHIVPGFILLPIIDKDVLREMFRFGLWSWFSGIAGTIFTQADRIIIGIMLGMSPLGYYAVCLQVARQVHGLLAASFYFLFPVSSAATVTGELERIRSIYARSLAVVSVVSTFISIPIFIMAGNLLNIWMGSGFGDQAGSVLRVLVFAHALLATSVVPHYFLAGTGHIKANTLFGSLSSGLVLLGSAAMIGPLGLTGAALGRLCNFPSMLLTRTYLHRKILLDKRKLGALPFFLPVLLPFLLSGLYLFRSGEPRALSLTALVIYGILWSVLGGMLSWAVVRVFKLDRLGHAQ